MIHLTPIVNLRPKFVAMSFISYFDQHRVINLEHRTDRRQMAIVEFERHGQGQPDFFTTSKPKSAPTPDWPTVGAFGCFMSHLAVLRSFVESDAERLLVMEDDVKFFFQPDYLVDELRRLPWDIVYFGALNAPSTTDRGLVLMPTDPGLIGAHCYSVNRKAARAYVCYLDAARARPGGHPLGGPQHVDGAFAMCQAQNPELVIRLCSPLLAGQHRTETDIHDDPVSQIKRLPVVRSLLRLIRQRAWQHTGG